MNNKKTVVIVLIVAMMSVVGGVASAQTDDSGDRLRNRQGMFAGRNFEGEIMDIIAEATGLTPLELRQEVRDGATLAEVITENGGDVDAVADEIVAVMAERLDERVETQLETLEERVAALLNGEVDRPGRGDGPRAGNFGDRLPGGIGEAVMEATGLTLQEIGEQLRAGNSMIDILTAAGVDLDVFTAEILADAEARLAERVEAGRITQEQADERLESLTERLNAFLSNTDV